MINFKNNKNNKGENVMLNKEIEFDERWNRDDGSCVLWFTAPKELLETIFPHKYPEAEDVEISLEFPTLELEAENATVEISPTKYDEDEESYVDYDWCEIDIPLDEIEALIKLAKKSERI